MQRLLSITALFVFAIASGCSNNVDHASAMKVMGSALTTTAAADGKVTGVDWKPFNGQVSVTLTDPAGGSAVVSGTASDVNGVISTTVDISFNHWVDVVENVTLDGSLHEAGSFTTALPLAGNVQLTGALAASGSVNAAVDFDIKGAYGPGFITVNGQVGGNVINGGINVTLH